MKPAPLVSLCLAVRNEARFIAETLDSILGQTLQDFEVQIFDNASDDATPEICERYLDDPRFTLHRNAADIGQVANFNRCYGMARGRYVCLLSGNDVLAESYLEKLIAVAEADPAVGLVAARLKVIDESSTPLTEERWVRPVYFQTNPDDPVAAGSAVVRHWRFHNYAFGVYRRSVLERLQPLRYLFGSDASFIYELALYARIRVHPEPLFGLRKHNRQQVLHQTRVFSEDTTYGISPISLFSHFDLMTPFIDLTWSYIETTAFARIPLPAKDRLTQAIPLIQHERVGDLIAAEVERLKSSAGATLEILRSRPETSAHRALAHRLQIRLGRAAVIVPSDAVLSDLLRAVSDLLQPDWPGRAPPSS
ncbi:MAG: glycosyltransferase family 2 protein [Alphaproteobacteria bacterium]